MEKPRVEIPSAEFQIALAVWLRTEVPRHVWERYVKFEKKRLEKRDTEEDAIDPRDELAKVIAAKLAQVGWEIWHVPKGNVFETVASMPGAYEG